MSEDGRSRSPEVPLETASASTSRSPKRGALREKRAREKSRERSTGRDGKGTRERERSRERDRCYDKKDVRRREDSRDYERDRRHGDRHRSDRDSHRSRDHGRHGDRYGSRSGRDHSRRGASPPRRTRSRSRSRSRARKRDRGSRERDRDRKRSSQDRDRSSRNRDRSSRDRDRSGRDVPATKDSDVANGNGHAPFSSSASAVAAAALKDNGNGDDDGPEFTLEMVLRENPGISVTDAMKKLAVLRAAHLSVNPAAAAAPRPYADPVVAANLATAFGGGGGGGTNGIGSGSFAGLGGAGTDVKAADLERRSREAYIGGLPAGITKEQLEQFLAAAMGHMNLVLGHGSPITQTNVGPDGLYAFVEFRSAHECQGALRLNGIQCSNTTLRIGRPKNFTDAQMAAAKMGMVPSPPQPSPTVPLPGASAMPSFDVGCRTFASGAPYEAAVPASLPGISAAAAAALAAAMPSAGFAGAAAPAVAAAGSAEEPPLPTDPVAAAAAAAARVNARMRDLMGGGGGGSAALAAGLGMPGGPGALGAAASAAPDSNVLMVNNLPEALSEEHVRELMGPFGAVVKFNLLVDGDGRSKGTAAAEYADGEAAAMALAGLQDLAVGGARLMVQRVSAAVAAALLRPVKARPRPKSEEDLQEAEDGGQPSAVVRLTNVVEVKDLADEAEYKDILEDVTGECAQYGVVRKVEIPRPTVDDAEPPGCGMVFVEFADHVAAGHARKSLQGRTFAGKAVQACFFPADLFKQSVFALPSRERYEADEAAKAAKAAAARAAADSLALSEKSGAVFVQFDEPPPDFDAMAAADFEEDDFRGGGGGGGGVKANGGAKANGADAMMDSGDNGGDRCGMKDEAMEDLPSVAVPEEDVD